MKKSDLKFGMVVELKNGCACLIEPAANCNNLSIKDYLIHEREYNVRFRNIKTARWETSLEDFNLDLTHNNDDYSIRCVYEDFTLNKRLWVRKEPLLTDEERDWLAAVIKPFRDRVVDVSIQSGEYDDENFIAIDVEGDSVTLPYIAHLPFKFKGLNVDEFYSLDQLGI